MMEKEFRRTIFVPVGTSLMTKANTVRIDERNIEGDIEKLREDLLKSPTAQNVEWQCWRECFVAGQSPIKFFSKYMEEIVPSDETQRRKSREFTRQNPDGLTAELASIYLFYAGMEQDNDPKDEIILLASDTDEGLYCACFLADYLMQKEPYKSHISEVYVERIIGLDGGDSDIFEKDGINSLISQTTELIKERQDKRSLYLNVTGGYKGVLPYLVLLGLSFGEMKTFYLFELSPNIVWLPKLPVGFDLLTWRNYRAFVHSIPHIEGLEKEDLVDFIPDSMRTLLEREKVDNKFPLTALGEELQNQYDKERGKEISEYGRGYLLTDEIDDPKKRQALKDRIDHWQYLWLGDLIPETVEHARGHAQRDLELLAQIIHPILNKESNFFGEGKTDDSLLILLASTWLHDLGHSGSYLCCKQDEKTIRDMRYEGSGCEIIERDIEGFPSMVRDIHHILSWHLIDKDRNKLFRQDETDIFDDDLVEGIRRICLYHRGKMPVVKKNDPYTHIGIKISEPLEELNSDRVNLPLLGALLRIVDEGDVQQERTVGEEYETMRSIQTERELERLKIEEEDLRKIVKTTFGENSVPPSLPDYLKFCMKVSENYFEEMNAGDFALDEFFQELTEIREDDFKKLEELKHTDFKNYKDEYLDYVVDGCVRKFVQQENLDGIGDGYKLFISNWLSTLNQIIFKKRPPSHFKKHRGIRAMMYLLEHIDDIPDGKYKYHFKVLAIYRKDEGQKKICKHNAEDVLTDIKKEYGKVKEILNENRIYFDSFCVMEEGKDTMDCT